MEYGACLDDDYSCSIINDDLDIEAIKKELQNRDKDMGVLYNRGPKIPKALIESKQFAALHSYGRGSLDDHANAASFKQMQGWMKKIRQILRPILPATTSESL